jgi:hypothetical protein
VEAGSGLYRGRRRCRGCTHCWPWHRGAAMRKSTHIASRLSPAMASTKDFDWGLCSSSPPPLGE